MISSVCGFWSVQEYVQAGVLLQLRNVLLWAKRARRWLHYSEQTGKQTE